MLVLILDNRTVLSSASEAMLLCIHVVIPSLLPYFIFSNLLVASLRGKWVLPLIGFVGGYPAGAQAIRTAYDQQNISEHQARRYLVFCNNAGPAFIFGMISQMFTKAYVPWVLWSIHITGSLLIARMVLQNEHSFSNYTACKKDSSLQDVLLQSIKAIGMVCSWVILFKIMLNTVSAKLLNHTSVALRISVTGLVELTNGCSQLHLINSEYLRFVICAGFLGFGGVCVLFQSISVAKGLGTKEILLGKTLHLGISLVLSALIGYFMF